MLHRNHLRDGQQPTHKKNRIGDVQGHGKGLHELDLDRKVLLPSAYVV